MKWSSVIFIVVVFGILLFVQRKFFPEVKTIIHTDTIPFRVDSIVYKDSLVPYKVEVPTIDSVEIPIDSAKLVAKYLALHQEYFTTRFYKDSTGVDSIGFIITSFKVTQNKAFEYKLHYNLEKKKIINQTLANPKNSLYIGAQFGVQNLTPIVIWDNKQKMNYFVSYNLTRKEVNVGVAININKIKLW